MSKTQSGSAFTMQTDQSGFAGPSILFGALGIGAAALTAAPFLMEATGPVGAGIMTAFGLLAGAGGAFGLAKREETTRRQVTALTSVTETSDLASAILNPQGEFVLVNEAMRGVVRRMGNAFLEQFAGLHADRLEGSSATALLAAMKDRPILGSFQAPVTTELKIGDTSVTVSLKPLIGFTEAPGHVLMTWMDQGQQGRGKAIEAKQIMAALERDQAVIEFEPDGTIITANENFLTASGYRLDEITGKHHSLFMLQADKTSSDYAEFWRQLANGQPQKGEFERVTKTGATLWLRAVYNPITDDQGKVVKVIKLAIDITEQVDVQARQALEAANNARIKAALDNCQTNVMVADQDHNIVYTNKTMMQTLGEAERDIQKDLPDFRVATVVGTNIDSFHKNPAHQRTMLASMKEPRRIDLVIGGLNMVLNAVPVITDDGERVGTVVEWRNETAEREAETRRVIEEANSARIKAALDNCQTNVMVADQDHNIIYTNKAMMDTLTEAERDIQKDLPNFSVATVVGTNIDSFHKNPSHQRTMLAAMKDPRRIDLTIGGLNMVLNAVPVTTDGGERVGTVVEWRNETAERRIQKEVDTVVEGVIRGDFNQRIGLDDKEGFMLGLAKSLNELCANTGEAMDNIVGVVSALSAGDLTRRMDGSYQGIFDKVQQDTNQMAQSLSEIVGQIKNAAAEVSSAASEITASTTDLSQRTEQQASNLEETASAMEEIATTVKQNAQNARQANQVAVGARDAAVQGGEVVDEAVKAMSDIERSSTKISEIITVIDEIAFQTNLLALNAAVEAARAGDAGRGFAVVASEVRNLAQRSSQAAKDIKDLIVHSSEQVAGGVDLVNRTGEALGEIVGSIKSVADIVSEIAAASNEQATGIEEINGAVGQMDEMTQQNSALVEENAASAKTLSDQATAMARRVEFFTLDETATAPVQPAAVEAPSPRPAARPVSPARSLQSALAVAVEDDPEWKEF